MTVDTILDIMAETKEELSKKDKKVAEAIYNGLQRQFKAIDKRFERRAFNEKVILTEIKELMLGKRD